MDVNTTEIMASLPRVQAPLEFLMVHRHLIHLYAFNRMVTLGYLTTMPDGRWHWRTYFGVKMAGKKRRVAFGYSPDAPSAARALLSALGIPEAVDVEREDVGTGQLLAFAATMALAARRYRDFHKSPYRAVCMALGEGLSSLDWEVGRMIARAVLRGRFHRKHGLCMRAQELDYMNGKGAEEFAKTALLRDEYDLSRGKLGGAGKIVAFTPADTPAATPTEGREGA